MALPSLNRSELPPRLTNAPQRRGGRRFVPALGLGEGGTAGAPPPPSGPQAARPFPGTRRGRRQRGGGAFGAAGHPARPGGEARGRGPPRRLEAWACGAPDRAGRPPAARLRSPPALGRPLPPLPPPAGVELGLGAALGPARSASARGAPGSAVICGALRKRDLPRPVVNNDPPEPSVARPNGEGEGTEMSGLRVGRLGGSTRLWDGATARPSARPRPAVRPTVCATRVRLPRAAPGARSEMWGPGMGLAASSGCCGSVWQEGRNRSSAVALEIPCSPCSSVISKT